MKRNMERIPRGRRANDGFNANLVEDPGFFVARRIGKETRFFKKHGSRGLLFPESPEIVVEVISRSNCLAEREEKRRLYFETGAKEFWICDKNSNMRFFNSEGELGKSDICRGIPRHISTSLLRERKEQLRVCSPSGDFRTPGRSLTSP